MSDPAVPARTHAGTNSPPLARVTSDEGRNDRSEPRVRRRNRIIKSCLECRRRKLKCDKLQPCANCVKVSRQCHFIAPGSDPVAQAKLAEVKEKMGILERSLEADLAQKRRDEEPSDDDEDDEIRNLDPTQMAEYDAAYYEDEEANDDVVDLGIAMGKVRITERIGGLMRPKFSEELSQSLKEIPDQDAPRSMPDPGDPDDWMLPSQEFVAPSSSFMFAPGVEKTSIMHYLPSKILVDKLLVHYWQAVHTVARTVHRPSFERQYMKFWDDINVGLEPRASFQAVVFAALLSSVISMSEGQVLHGFAVHRQSLIENFRQGTESALSRANLLRTTKLETLQAFVMYLIPLCRAEVSRAHSALTGTCIRLAECMGLHRDPSAYSSSPIECQVRRLVWHQICFLDIRTCEATGPRPQIRADDYDTRFPTNIDDADLDRAENGENVEVRDQTCFTDMTITRMRFECYEMHRILWVERPKIGVKKKDGEKSVTITSLLTRVQAFKARMEQTYLPMLSKSNPLHVIASKHYGIASDRLYPHILQRFVSSDKYAMPDRLRQIIIGASLRILEHSMDIERHPALAIWSWYTGALHQYHVSLLLMNEMYIAHIDPELEQRIWVCLDYTFELRTGGSGVAKVRTILRDLIDKLDVYANVKRWRAPKNMPEAGRRLHAAGHSSRHTSESEIRDLQERGASLVSPGGSSTSTHSGSHSEHHSTQQGSHPNSDFHASQTPPTHPSTHTSQPQPQYYSTQPSPFRSSLPFGGPAIPHTEWKTFDSTITPQYANPPPPQQHSTAPPPWVPTPTSPDPPLPQPPLPSAAASDPLRDIDWNEIDQLFDGPHAHAGGNMMSPPYTFPPFEAGDLMLGR